MVSASLGKSHRTTIILLISIALVFAACAPPPALAPPTATRAPAVEPAPTQAGAPDATEPAEPAAPAAEGQSVWEIAAEGNEARYVVTEQLANRDFPSDAIGVTSSLTGQLVINPDGSVVSDASNFTVDLTTLQSDRSMRDRFLQRNTLQTNQFPTAEFVPTTATGLPSPLPTSGEVTFQLVGDMTVHGVTQPTTWEVSVQVNGQELTGQATTDFTFDHFGLEIPRVMSVLSVEDNIRLEYDFHLVQQS